MTKCLTLCPVFGKSWKRMDSKKFTTSEVAAKIGISRQTLYSWIEDGKIVAPKTIAVGKNTIRLWTKADIDQARKFKGTSKVGRKGKQKK